MTTVDKSETAEAFRKARAQAGRDEPELLGNVRDAVINFTKVEKFTTFLAEYAFVDGAIVLHFFPPREAYEVSIPTQQPRVTAEFLRHWRRAFPMVLSPVAEAHFKASAPVVTATYIEEMTSWWMRAAGFAERLDPDSFIMRFFELLDQALDAA